MEMFVNHAVFKLFGLMPIFNYGDQLWKSLLNVCYSLCVIAFVVLQQFNIYIIQQEQDLSGWFIITSVLVASFVILVQALATGTGMQQLMVELMEINSLLGGVKRRTRHFTATFYTLYSAGIGRNVFRTFLLIHLEMRAPTLGFPLVVPMIIVLVRVNLQIYLMELIASLLDAIATELSVSLVDDDRYTMDEANATHQYRRILQRTEYLFGRLQKCLLMVNTLFGWSTAAIVVVVFIAITFQFRIPMYPMPFYGRSLHILQNG
uniref:Uncharacterized protein n=1 Tax=Anopheles culicifacies TaxID=139723 RepID=A0A182LXS9_9DIPT